MFIPRPIWEAWFAGFYSSLCSGIKHLCTRPVDVHSWLISDRNGFYDVCICSSEACVFAYHFLRQGSLKYDWEKSSSKPRWNMCSEHVICEWNSELYGLIVILLSCSGKYWKKVSRISKMNWKDFWQAATHTWNIRSQIEVNRRRCLASFTSLPIDWLFQQWGTAWAHNAQHEKTVFTPCHIQFSCRTRPRIFIEFQSVRSEVSR